VQADYPIIFPLKITASRVLFHIFNYELQFLYPRAKYHLQAPAASRRHACRRREGAACLLHAVKAAEHSFF
jgi:hypothetical protein